MIAVDTNILVYAHRQESPQHQIAYKTIKDLAEGSKLWALAWPTIYEFCRVVTHSKIYSPPTVAGVATEFIQELFKSPQVRILGHGRQHFEVMSEELQNTFPKGNFFFDLQLACIYKEHGVKEVITADSDFLKFKFLKVTNPFSKRSRE